MTIQNQGRPRTAIDTTNNLEVADTEVEAWARSQAGSNKQERENQSLDEKLHCPCMVSDEKGDQLKGGGEILQGVVYAGKMRAVAKVMMVTLLHT